MDAVRSTAGQDEPTDGMTWEQCELVRQVAREYVEQEFEPLRQTIRAITDQLRTDIEEVSTLRHAEQDREGQRSPFATTGPRTGPDNDELLSQITAIQSELGTIREQVEAVARIARDNREELMRKGPKGQSTGLRTSC